MSEQIHQKSPTCLARLSEDGSILLGDERLWLVPAESGDRNFIISTWVKSYLTIARKKLQIHESVYFERHPAIAEALWQHAFVLRDEQDGSAIMGYVVVNNGILHYAYVVPEIRKLGVFNAMVAAALGSEQPVIVSHRWPFKEPPNWLYNPYEAMIYGKRTQA